jgi:hypothetical protein
VADRSPIRGLRGQPLRQRRERKDSGVIPSTSAEATLSLQELGRTLVGQMSLKEAQRVLRTCMSQEAITRCNGSRRAAAALLGIDRRYVQRLVGISDGELDDGDDVGDT